MNVIQEITTQTSAGTGATAQSIGNLAEMALDLRESVAGFKLPEEEEPEELTLASAQSADIELDQQDIDYDTQSEEHTSELQSRGHLVCRLLLEKKKIIGIQ